MTPRSRERRLHRPYGLGPQSHRPRAGRPGQPRPRPHRSPTAQHPDKWAISLPGTYQPLVSDSGFIAVQNLRAERSDAKHDYRLRGLLRCALCERTFEGHWVNQTPGYRCRHGHHSAIDPGTPRPKSVYLREDRVLAKLPLLHHLLSAAEPAAAITAHLPAPPAPSR